MLSATLLVLGLTVLAALAVVERIIKPDWPQDVNVRFKTRMFGAAAILVILSGVTFVGSVVLTAVA